jgi:septal ring factor EnvC (AmiA/AmiB activator)
MIEKICPECLNDLKKGRSFNNNNHDDCYVCQATKEFYKNRREIEEEVIKVKIELKEKEDKINKSVDEIYQLERKVLELEIRIENLENKE